MNPAAAEFREISCTAVQFASKRWTGSTANVEIRNVNKLQLKRKKLGIPWSSRRMLPTWECTSKVWLSVSAKTRRDSTELIPAHRRENVPVGCFTLLCGGFWLLGAK
jgi:hypothetical protein